MWVLVIFWYDTMTPLQHGNNGLHFKCFHCLYNWTIYVAMISTALKTLYCCGCGSCALVKCSCCRYCITHDIFLISLLQFYYICGNSIFCYSGFWGHTNKFILEGVCDIQDMAVSLAQWHVQDVSPSLWNSTFLSFYNWFRTFIERMHMHGRNVLF